MRISAVIFLLGIAVYANSEACPPDEEITPCKCERVTNTDDIRIECRNEDGKLEAGDLTNPMKNLVGKKNVELEIENFDLTEMPFDFFQGTGIVRLTISKCAVPSVTKEDQLILVGLENSLEVLRIKESITEGNDISKLRFGHLQQLKEVYFYFNKIPEVRAGWFENSKLEVVSFIYNYVKEIEDGAFASLNNLRLFEFRGERKLRGSFKRSLLPDPADRLTELLFHYNGWSSLEEDIFSNMPALKELWITDNEISTLDRRTWEPVWEQLDKIYLTYNPIQCDSDLKWTFELRRPPRTSGCCVGPPNVEGQCLDKFIDNAGKYLPQNFGKKCVL